MGKAFRLSVEAPDEPAARGRATEMADRLLANPVIEDSTVTVLGPGAPTPSATTAVASGAR